MQRALLSTADVAALFSVAETTVKRWADEGRLKCQKTPGGHRKFDVGNVMEFSGAYGLTPSGTLAASDYGNLGKQAEVALLSRDFERLASMFVESALSDANSSLVPFFSYMYHHHLQLWEIFDHVVQPGMKIIGDLWKQGDVSVGYEHRSSERVTDALALLRAEIHTKPRHGKSALCACPEEIMHELGLRCASLALEADGWVVHYLGANTPFESIAEVGNQLHPSLVCLSVSGVGTDPAFGEHLRKLYRTVRRRKAKLVIGGSAVSPDFFRHDECDKALSSTHELLEFARQLTGYGNRTKR